MCLRQSPPLWLWVGVSRLTRQALGFALGDRSDAMLSAAWGDVPEGYRALPVCTDFWGAYARFFSEEQHRPCGKGSGLTSIAEGLNTKWRQRQSGLVRRSCGVYVGITDDLFERFLLLVGSHNAECARRWERRHPTMR